MSTTDAGIKTITLTEDELDPYVTHAATRRWLAGPGLPDDGGLLTFEALRTDGPRTVADSTGDPDLLAEDLRDLLVIGALLGGPADAETESVLLDGATGEVSTTYFFHDRPDLMDRRPLAPSLQALTEFVAATEEMAARRGRFASYEGRFGPKAVAAMSQQLLAVFEERSGRAPVALGAGRAGGGGRHAHAVEQVVHGVGRIGCGRGAATGLDLGAQIAYVLRQRRHGLAAPVRLGAQLVGPAVTGVDPGPQDDRDAAQRDQHADEEDAAPARGKQPLEPGHGAPPSRWMSSRRRAISDWSAVCIVDNSSMRVSRSAIWRSSRSRSDWSFSVRLE
ncbi:SUKH-4 family immunity protein [Streptomyces umbrinus]